MACVKCNSGILSNEQCYFVADVGPELLFIIQQQLTSEMADDAILCGTCFNHAMNGFTNSCNSSKINKNITIQPIGETPVARNKCVWCLLTLSGRRTHSLPIGPQRNLISTRIAPRLIPDGGLVCYRCWVQASRLMNASTSTRSTQEQSPNICVRCRYSLAVRRAHSIPYGPERDVITAGIAPRQILPGDKVCYSCWVSAQRTVHRANNPKQYNRNGCTVCSISIVRRQTHLLPNGPVRDVISRRIYPRQITNHALVCNECWTWAQDTVRQEINDPFQPESDQERPLQVLDMPRHIELNSYRKVGMSSARCFVPGCTNIERCTVPKYLRNNMLAHFKIYICENARVCMYHKTIDDWDNIINLDELNNTFSAAEIEKMMFQHR